MEYLWSVIKRSDTAVPPRATDGEQSVVKVPRHTETDAGPGEQDEKRENTGSIRPRNNADRRDAASVECSGTGAADR